MDTSFKEGDRVKFLDSKIKAKGVNPIDLCGKTGTVDCSPFKHYSLGRYEVRIKVTLDSPIDPYGRGFSWIAAVIVLPEKLEKI